MEEISTDIEAVLIERGNRYGEFDAHSQITQDLKTIMQDTPNWSTLEPDMKEALEMIQHKIGRILNGDPYYDDSWIDIGGYSKLVADKLQCCNPKQGTLCLDEDDVKRKVYGK
jgi:hypothetical protein